MFRSKFGEGSLFKVALLLVTIFGSRSKRVRSQCHAVVEWLLSFQLRSDESGNEGSSFLRCHIHPTERDVLQ